VIRKIRAVGRDPVVVLGHDFWVSQYNASPSVVGSKVSLNGVDFTIIGVAPRHFTGIDQFIRPAMFIPLAMSPHLGNVNNLERRDVRWLIVKGRLKPGVSVGQAQADVAAVAAQLQQMYPQTDRAQRFAVQTELQLRNTQSPPNSALVLMLGLLSLCVLTVACANVTGLLLSRSRARSREIAIRLAIGAGRGSLIRQLFLENLLLALTGGLLGIAVAYGGARFFSASLSLPTCPLFSRLASITEYCFSQSPLRWRARFYSGLLPPSRPHGRIWYRLSKQPAPIYPEGLVYGAVISSWLGKWRFLWCC
jgi:ABC-type antimicrobial peptide transport system permease subunit